MIPRNLRRENLQVTEETIHQAVLAGGKRFKILSHAYSTLTDPEKRALYNSGASVQEENYSEFDFEAFFKNFPIGAHIDKQSFKNMLTKINQKLDRTLSKSSTDCRYRKIASVITALKQELTAAEPQDTSLTSQTIAQEFDIIPGVQVYQFLLDAQIAIQRAKTTREPGAHRGLLLGTPILRELTILGLAICRFICFAFLKVTRYFNHDNRPVFQEGMCFGLFKPPKTRTLYYLDSFENALEFHKNMISSSMDGLREHGKSYSHLCFHPKDEYFVDEILNFSM